MKRRVGCHGLQCGQEINMTTHLHGLKDRCILGLRGLALNKEEEVGDPQSLVE